MIPNLVVVLYDDDVLHPVISILITYEHTTDIPPPSPPDQPQIYLNILFLTPLFIETGCPSSYSTPEAPPSPACSCIFS